MKVAFEDIDKSSRIWIYQADRNLSDEEVSLIRSELDSFLPEWTAHSHQLYAAGDVRYNRFVLIAVDESHAGASGCSIDKSVALIKKLEQKTGINFFDRMKICYLKNGDVKDFPLQKLEELYNSGEIRIDTPVFNNLVATKSELDQSWPADLNKTWLASRLPQAS